MPEFDAAPLDTTARVVTGMTVVLLAGIGGVMVVTVPLPIGIGIAVVYGGILVLAWALAPQSYALDGTVLVVRRNAWREYRTPLLGLATMERPHRMGLRVGGSGGGFGWYGRFRRRDVGSYRAYLTHRDEHHVVALQSQDGVVTISPADPDGFRRAVQSLGLPGPVVRGPEGTVA